MRKRLQIVVIILLLSVFILYGCNLPSRHIKLTPTQSTLPLEVSTPTPAPLCANQYLPTTAGEQWEYSGSDSFSGAYTRTDKITDALATAFTQSTSIGETSYSVVFDCTSSGLTSGNPIEQYAGALLSSPNVPVSVKMTSNSGITLPARINPGDTWQQVADFQATSPQLNVNGRFVFAYTAVGYENVTVPAGTYNALRVDATISIELTILHVPAGTYTTTSWWVPEVGLVKSEGTSHVTGVDFSDSMELVKFTQAP